ncbi:MULTISPECIES: dihydroxyacetone kinase subunit DhaL [Microbacterium]|uniref:dihydroxyacetone kinase subunit DhaL n=1 Tax=Microbacterium barkeri TaxID=33917 RepID=UPI0024AFA3A9|nr:dihydroxyacetone kinase subunit DhaL [Microbacterium barkeri]MDI6944827.1 dihydroxyacetone kinase subunit DhaL [Microbacterium barkeri]
MAFDIAALGRWVALFRDRVSDEQERLTALDSAIGDADHGANMARGTAAAVAKLESATPTTVGEFGKAVGMALVSTVGGASGPLYGTFFLRFGASGGDGAELDGPALAAALRAGLEGVVSRGKAEPGDKTMIDAMTPAVDAFEADASDLVSAARSAAQAARAGSDATEPLVARKGRASYLGERSAGHLDPGSVSTALLFEALAAAAEEVSA